MTAPTLRPSAVDRHDEILDAVLELIETGGYDATTVRRVAETARVSLTTIYKLFGSQNSMVAAALARWLEVHAYARMRSLRPVGDPYEDVLDVIRSVFEPWVESPHMLRAFVHALRLPGAEALTEGLDTALPAMHAALAGADEAFVADFDLILLNVQWALIGQFADGMIGIEDVFPRVERTVMRLLADNRNLGRGDR